MTSCTTDHSLPLVRNRVSAQSDCRPRALHPVKRRRSVLHTCTKHFETPVFANMLQIITQRTTQRVLGALRPIVTSLIAMKGTVFVLQQTHANLSESSSVRHHKEDRTILSGLQLLTTQFPQSRPPFHLQLNRPNNLTPRHRAICIKPPRHNHNNARPNPQTTPPHPVPCRNQTPPLHSHFPPLQTHHKPLRPPSHPL